MRKLGFALLFGWGVLACTDTKTPTPADLTAAKSMTCCGKEIGRAHV